MPATATQRKKRERPLVVDAMLIYNVEALASDAAFARPEPSASPP